MPPGFDVSAAVDFITDPDSGSLELNDLEIGVSNLNGGAGEPIADTGLFLQSITGTINHIAAGDPVPTLFTGSVTLTAGPQIDINLPSWAGGEVKGSLIALTLTGSIDSNHLSASGTMTVANGLVASESATVTDNWNEGVLEGQGQCSLLGGAVTATASFKVDSELDLTLQGTATLSLGPIFPAPFSSLASAWAVSPEPSPCSTARACR